MLLNSEKKLTPRQTAWLSFIIARVAEASSQTKTSRSITLSRLSISLLGLSVGTFTLAVSLLLDQIIKSCAQLVTKLNPRKKNNNASN